MQTCFTADATHPQLIFKSMNQTIFPTQTFDLLPPEGGALSSVSVAECGLLPGERDSALSLFS